MADPSIFNRLKRLLSTQSVVRSTGGKRLRVTDTSMYQAHGSRATVDRYRRIYKAGQYGYNAQGKYDRYSSYQQSRLQLFRDYDLMDNDPIIASVLDIYADESTVKDEFSEIINIQSPNEEIQKHLYNLFYDVLNVEFNLWPWIRNLCKYGDFFLYLMLDQESGIVNVLPLSVYETYRIEGDEKTGNPFYVKFKVESDFSYLSREEFENYEIAHFRLLGDSNFLPYGKSMLENGRRIFKQVRLMEDAMLIHRITRAPDKRVFRIDVGNIPPNEIESYMERIVEKVKRAPLVDQQTGDYDLRYNMQNILEDFYLPVRGKDTGTEISNLQGMTYNAIEDIEYLQKKLMAAFKIPRAFLGYEEDLSGKATLAAMDVRFARTIERIQRAVISELTKIAIIHLFIKGYTDDELVNFELSLTNPSMVYELEKINLWKEKITLATTLTQSRFVSREWIYNNILEMTDEEMVVEQEKILDDSSYEAEIQKVAQETLNPTPEQPVPQEQQPSDENSSNLEETDEDPSDNNELFGTEVSIDDVEQFSKALERTLSSKKKTGRPPEGHKYSSDADKLGRDPLAYKEIMAAMDVLPKKKAKITNSDLREALRNLEKEGFGPSSDDKNDSNLLSD